jgi:homoserine dehydrogenase
LVREAIDRGVAEPDPREDLSGRDLARKALILARTAGWTAELSEVDVEPLYPKTMETIHPGEFVSALERLDESMEESSRQARRQDACLRYTVELSPGSLRVGLTQVPLDQALARLRGSEQLVSIETAIYRDTPLVIQGRGAGVEATASGMLSDIMEVGLNRYAVESHSPSLCRTDLLQTRQTLPPL